MKVVNVEEVYAAYSGGVFDAAAIKNYVRHAILEDMGVEYCAPLAAVFGLLQLH